MSQYIDYRRMRSAVTWGVFSALFWFFIALVLCAIAIVFFTGVGATIWEQFQRGNI